MSDGEILTNIEFDYQFLGKSYKITKANLRKVMEFQRRAMEITKKNDNTADLEMAALALHLALSPIDPSITIDYILDNAPGDLNALEILITLGFLSQQKAAIMVKMQDALAKQPSGESSSAR